MSRFTVGIICGGRSAEHEVSLQSARNIVAALDPEKYQILVIGVDPKGVWWLLGPRDFLLNPDDPAKIALRPGSRRVMLTPWPSETPIIEMETGQSLQVDVLFPIIHGPLGEDGTIQGLLQLAGIPFVGADVAASAICMDKHASRRLLGAAGIKTAKTRVIRAGQPVPRYAEFRKDLGEVLFVKPARLGSSVGVSRVSSPSEFKNAVGTALRYDSLVLVEEEIKGQEVECSVLGNATPKASALGEVRPRNGFYSYDAKYLDAEAAELIVPAELDPAVAKRVQETAIQAYLAVGCEGLARIDFFVKHDGTVVVNEINTLPGFTNISMYPRLWAESGLPVRELVDQLIQLALDREKQRSALATAYLEF